MTGFNSGWNSDVAGASPGGTPTPNILNRDRLNTSMPKLGQKRDVNEKCQEDVAKKKEIGQVFPQTIRIKTVRDGKEVVLKAQRTDVNVNPRGSEAASPKKAPGVKFQVQKSSDAEFQSILRSLKDNMGKTQKKTPDTRSGHLPIFFSLLFVKFR